MSTFEEWFEAFDLHKLEPYSMMDSKFQIEYFLRLAYDAGYTDGYESGLEVGMNQ